MSGWSLRSTPSTRRSSLRPLSALARISAKLSTSSGGGSAVLYGRGLGLDRDHRHVVGDDVVQFPGDALALFEQGALALVAALGDLQLLAAAAPGADDDPDGHRDARRRTTAVMVGWPSTMAAPNTVTRAAATTTHGLQRTATAYRHRT